ncbi:trichohyalin-like, partial [Elysia marginata]
TLLLKTLHHKHVDEWKVMLALLSSDGFRTLRETVAVETALQRDNKITCLHRERDNLDLKETSKHHKILEEALAFKLESVRQILSQTDQPDQVKEEDLHAHLISQLLQFQLVEAQIYLEAFTVEDDEDIRENRAAILTEISQGHVSNIALVAFSGPSVASMPSVTSETSKGDDFLGNVELTEAVSGKYDALRDQLLIQALIDQMGEAEWNRLSSLEKQRQLIQLKLKEQRLRREGKYDEAAALLGELRSNDNNIKMLLEEARALHDQKFRERLERRRARLAQGVYSSLQ